MVLGTKNKELDNKLFHKHEGTGENGGESIHVTAGKTERMTAEVKSSHVFVTSKDFRF